MKNCPSCGVQNADFNSKCESCGKALPDMSSARYQGIDDYLIQAILVTIFCCLPFGIVGIVYAAQVKGFAGSGNEAAARSASESAKFWTHLGFGLGIAIAGIYAISKLITN